MLYWVTNLLYTIQKFIKKHLFGLFILCIKKSQDLQVKTLSYSVIRAVVRKEGREGALIQVDVWYLRFVELITEGDASLREIMGSLQYPKFVFLKFLHQIQVGSYRKGACNNLMKNLWFKTKFSHRDRNVSKQKEKFIVILLQTKYNAKPNHFNLNTLPGYLV